MAEEDIESHPIMYEGRDKNDLQSGGAFRKPRPLKTAELFLFPFQCHNLFKHQGIKRENETASFKPQPTRVEKVQDVFCARLQYQAGAMH
jgi:hypothetical protein